MKLTQVYSPRHFLGELTLRIDNENSQGEYYLTDVVAEAYQRGISVAGVTAENEFEIAGINDAGQLTQRREVFRVCERMSICCRIAPCGPRKNRCRGSFEIWQNCF